MHITYAVFGALLALATAYDTNIWHKDVEYHITGLPEEGVKCSRGKHTMSSSK